MKYDYEPEFKANIREGKRALWVKMPDGREFNIWDIGKEEFESISIQRAITHAFYLGYEAMKEQVRQFIYSSSGRKFPDFKVSDEEYEYKR